MFLGVYDVLSYLIFIKTYCAVCFCSKVWAKVIYVLFIFPISICRGAVKVVIAKHLFDTFLAAKEYSYYFVNI